VTESFLAVALIQYICGKNTCKMMEGGGDGIARNMQSDRGRAGNGGNTREKL
jgi:hypothetical protein